MVNNRFRKYIQMYKVKKRSIHAVVFFMFYIIVAGYTAEAQSLKSLLSKSSSWYRSSEAVQIAENVLLFQRNTGGWAKGKDYFRKYTEEEKNQISNQKRKRDSTFDNDATYTELEYVARIFNATGDLRYRDALNLGLDMIFESQYDNGGWPQFYPEFNAQWSWDNSAWVPQGLERFITYNDHAMIGIMHLLKKITEEHPYFSFVDSQRKEMADEAMKKGIQCILKSQFYYDNRLTAWPAQVDEVTFEPKWARNF